MKRSAHRQPLVLTQRGKNLRDFLFCLALAAGIGVFGSLLVYGWVRP